MKLKAENLIVVLLVLGLIGMAGLVVLKPVNVNLEGKITGNTGTSEPENSIQVTGQSILSVDPNKAEIILGVETQEDTALESQQTNAEIMENVMSALRANGINKDDIKTYQYSVQPIRNWRSEENYYEVISYKTTQMIKVKTTDLENVGKVIDAAASAGANRFQGVSFGLTDEKQSEYRTEALKEASKNAESKANSIADGLGVKLDGVLRASESSYYQPVYRSYTMEAAVSGEAKDITTEISPGMIEVSATVSVSYEFI
ncbi:MAG: DUF541 domain-containing protein [Candidatus Aenigmarchaeota archaeon]|nr:DUF541 domain-containing protein [Candidatus Aenigmarchaeota archaeon]